MSRPLSRPVLVGVADRERVVPEQLVGLAEQDVDVAAAVELGGVLDADVGAAAAFDAVPAGELVDLEQVAVVEDQALRVFVRAACRSAVSFGRKMTCAIGSIVCVPQDCTLMNG